MNVLVIGSDGFLGKSIAESLWARGAQVFGMTRSGSLGIHERHHVNADRNDGDSIEEIVREKDIEVVVDLLAYDRCNTATVIEQLQKQCRYVLVSSKDVYRQYGWFQKLETGFSGNDLIRRDSPLRTSRYPYRDSQLRDPATKDAWMDNYEKIKVEALFREGCLSWTIVRLPMIYGPGDKQNRFDWALRPALSDEGIVEFPIEWLDWTSTYCFVENAGSFIAEVCGDASTSGQILVSVDHPAMSQSEWLALFAIACDWHGQVKGSSNRSLPLAQRTKGLDLKVHLKFDVPRELVRTGIKPVIDLQTAVRLTVEDAKRRLA